MEAEKVARDRFWPDVLHPLEAAPRLAGYIYIYLYTRIFARAPRALDSLLGCIECIDVRNAYIL